VIKKSTVRPKIVKLDASGSIQWNKTIGGFNLDELYSLQQTTEGGYILGRTSGSFSGGNVADYWIVKTDGQLYPLTTCLSIHDKT
jgi:hypothetical protein